MIDVIGTKNIKEEDVKILLIFYKIIYNKNYMFEDCETLIKFSIPNNYDNIDYSQLIKIHEGEENLFDFLYDDSTLSQNTLYQTLNNMESFSDFTSIPEQQNKSELHTVKKIYDSLDQIPNINQYDLGAMFYNCKSLISLSDIFEGEIRKVRNITYYLLIVHH